MIETEVTLKKWGSSIGTTFSKRELQKEGFKEGQKVRIHMMPVENILQKMFGTIKSKKPTRATLKQIRKELWNE